MFDQLDAVIHRFEELEARLSAPGLYDDPAAAAALLKERGDLEPIVVAARAYHAAEQQKAEAEEMLGDPDLKELAQDELRQAKDDLERLEGELKILLLPRDPNDDKNIIVEIRGGAGGEESALFAHSLYRMYTMYAEKRGWTVEPVSYTHLPSTANCSIRSLLRTVEAVPSPTLTTHSPMMTIPSPITIIKPCVLIWLGWACRCG